MSQNQIFQPTQSDPSEWHITRQWGSLGIRYCRHTCRFATDEAPWTYEDEHTLDLFLSPRPFRFFHQLDRQTHTGLYSHGDLLIAPAGTTLSTGADGDVQILQLRLQDSLLRKVAEETLDKDRIELVGALQTRDSQMEAIAKLFLAELQQESFGNQLYVDSLTNVLAVHLLRHHANTKPPLPIHTGGLAQHQLLQVIDYVEAHLEYDIALATLAELAGMSQFHFGRLFKQSLGLSPYQYLLKQRVERAKALLKGTTKPIGEIALDCGFNSQSHLGRKFRQLTGMTPRAYRSS